MAVTTLAVVILRYAFNTGSIIAQESIMYMHAAVFMLGIPYALKHNAHVRVDVFAERLGSRGRAWVDVLGHLLFLAPVCVTIIAFSLPYVATSWGVLEGSSEVGGIAGVFLLKTLIPLTAAVLLVQGYAEIIRLLPQLKANGHGQSDPATLV
jgi:TRAP-type mannitol/chloroaromatic compound transport system permease small subunit